jgi:hypothetical protein
MYKSEELKNPNSCLNKATDDEPLFVLRANDELAPSIVRTWAVMYHKAKAEQTGGITEAQRAKYDEAMALASMMEQWRFELALERIHTAATNEGNSTPRMRLQTIMQIVEPFVRRRSELPPSPAAPPMREVTEGGRMPDAPKDLDAGSGQDS